MRDLRFQHEISPLEAVVLISPTIVTTPRERGRECCPDRQLQELVGHVLVIFYARPFINLGLSMVELEA